MLIRHGTQYEEIMSATCTAIGRAKRDPEWAGKAFVGAPPPGHTLADSISFDMGFRPGNFAQPQTHALPIAPDPKTGKPVEKLIKTWPRPDIAGYFEKVPFLIPAIEEGYWTQVCPGSDQQGDVHRAKVGVWSVWGCVGPGGSTPNDISNRFQATLFNKLNLRPVDYTWDQFAWGCGFVPDGAHGNSTNRGPVMPMWAGAIGPDEVLDAITNGTKLTRATTHTVSHRCSMNGPRAPIVGATAIYDCEHPLIGAPGGYGCSASPALQLETKQSLFPVTGQVLDGTRLAVNKSASDITEHLTKNVGLKPGSTVFQAAFLLLENLTYSDVGHGTVQAQTGGACIIALDGARPAKGSTAPTWASLGFTQAINAKLLAGFAPHAEDWVVCAFPTSVDVKGQEWRRECDATWIGFDVPTAA